MGMFHSKYSDSAKGISSQFYRFSENVLHIHPNFRQDSWENSSTSADLLLPIFLEFCQHLSKTKLLEEPQMKCQTKSEKHVLDRSM